MNNLLKIALIILVLMAALFLIGLLFWLYYCNCGDGRYGVALSKSSQTTFTLGPAGLALQPDKALLVATRLSNASNRDAFKVQIHSITLRSELKEPAAPLLTPTAFPVLVGEINAHQSATLQASFDGKLLTPRKQYLLVMNGSYRPVNKGAYKDKRHVFTVTTKVVFPPAAPGSSPFKTITIDPHHVSGKTPFPPRTPSFDVEVNRRLPPVPTAPFVPGKPTATTTEVKPAPFGDPPAIVFDANNSLGINNSNDNTIAEPSGASAGKVVFVTGNLYAAYSTDGGSHFTRLDPTTIFPADIGLCCDQVVIYAPTIDRFIWLLQGPMAGVAPVGPNNIIPHGYRLAVASPADIVNYGGKVWSYWIVTPDQVGCTGDPVGGFDYPELSVSKNYLYMSWDAEGGPCNWGIMVLRTSLAGLQAGGQITVDFTDPTDGNGGFTRGGHLMQNPDTRIYWAGHNGNNTLRVFFWPEGQDYSWVDLGISSWANNSLSSITPDGNNWLGSEGNAIIGATGTGSDVWFAWTAGTDSNFQQAHIEMVTLHTLFGLQVSNQVQIWNSDYAFAYPALATNGCTGEVGLSFEYGGNGNYQNHVVGFWGDFVAYITTGSAVGTTRFGDYVAIRPAPGTTANPGNLFSAFGYGLNKVPAPGTGIMPDVHYVQFGRPASSCKEVPIPH